MGLVHFFCLAGCAMPMGREHSPVRLFYRGLPIGPSSPKWDTGKLSGFLQNKSRLFVHGMFDNCKAKKCPFTGLGVCVIIQLESQHSNMSAAQWLFAAGSGMLHSNKENIKVW